jgi:altronate hydrolase
MPETPPAVLLHHSDNVVIARKNIPAGADIGVDGLKSREPAGAGHKIAIRTIAKDAEIRRYGQIIGFASSAIEPGAHVHTHNCVMADFARDYAPASETRPTAYFNDPERALFQGYKRKNGKSGTRNYLAVLTSVNCSATVARNIARHFDERELEAFPNIDGVVALTHTTGCGMASSGDGYDALQRTLWGHAANPNIGGVLMVGLGCETAHLDLLLEAYGLKNGPFFQVYNIQNVGGTRHAIERGIAALREMLPVVNDVQRQAIPASELILALQCGGSDGYSGFTANPALGYASDLLVRHGGTAILSETPEIYGAEHLLTRRAVSPKIADKLIERIRWWEDYTARNRMDMNNNPSYGNKQGGLTTILEKSLGAASKGGTTNLVDVIRYADPVRERGLIFMDTPGFDPVSATGQVAGGANVMCFTTGRGSAYGNKPCPSIKIATNSALYERKHRRRNGECRRNGQNHFRRSARGRFRQAHKVGAVRLRRFGVRTLADRRHDVVFSRCSSMSRIAPMRSFR